MYINITINIHAVVYIYIYIYTRAEFQFTNLKFSKRKQTLLNVGVLVTSLGNKLFFQTLVYVSYFCQLVM